MKGKLKIFFGYAEGVGKTYAMLQAAHQASEQGIDVVAGYIETHSYQKTDELLAGIEQIPVKRISHEKTELSEFDLDAALRRKPQLILVDELAHTNAAGSRHVKRYKDVQELLNAGIDVYTTVNVWHIESLNDMVASITGMMVRERIPDSAFDEAEQVELVDIEPSELLARMMDKSISLNEHTKILTLENLTAMREIALRRMADRVNLLTESARMQSRSDYHTDEHILVCLSSSPANAKIIRTAARMARAFKGSFTALYVETSDISVMDEVDKKRLWENMRLAQQLGATVETTYGEDVSYQIAEFARLHGISEIVVGRSTVREKNVFQKGTLTEKLIAAVPNMDVHVIPVAEEWEYRPVRRKHSQIMSAWDVGRSMLVVLAATLIGYAFYALGVTEANIIAVYIFGVLIISIITTKRMYGLIASLVSVLVFNFFFAAPRFTFHFNESNYLVTFIIMFMVAFLTGSLAAKLKENAKQSIQAEFRTKILLETNQLLQKERNKSDILRVTAGQIIKLLKKHLVIYPSDGTKLENPEVYWTTDSEKTDLITVNEKEVAEWVMKNNRHAGATTDTLSNAKCLYLAIRQNNRVYGVVGICMDGIPLDSFENSVLLSILGECALALENIKNAEEKEEAAVLAKNEQLRANLLRAISHDLRTPLTSILGSAGNLMANYQKMDDEMREQTFTDIYDDSMWLINLVENLLAVTRIEGGRVNLTQTVELMDEVVVEALRHVNRKSKEHTICVHEPEDLLLAHIDVKLVVQLIINLVDNAIKYTNAGSTIDIFMKKEGKWIVVSVSDNGPGIPDEQKPHIFEMFYTGANRIADSRRSLGLGLSLCKSIVMAHGGQIEVSDNKPKGTVFTVTLPAGEVNLNE